MSDLRRMCVVRLQGICRGRRQHPPLFSEEYCPSGEIEDIFNPGELTTDIRDCL
jgi:hypothetical protein